MRIEKRVLSLQGLPEALLEAARHLHDEASDDPPAIVREPLPDELEGFAGMVADLISQAKAIQDPPPAGALPKAEHLRREQRTDGGYNMVPTYTTEEVEAIVKAERMKQFMETPNEMQTWFREVLQKWNQVYPRMNLYARRGSTVIFDGQGGYESQVESAKRILVLRGLYTVDHVEVFSSSSTVYLVGIKEGFNTVMFAAPPIDKAGKEPAECGANGSQGCSFGPHGPNRERQCGFCGGDDPSARLQSPFEALVSKWRDRGVEGTRIGDAIHQCADELDLTLRATVASS